MMKTSQTSGETAAHYHVTREDGPDAIDVRETDFVYTDGMWNAVNSVEVFNIYPLVG